VKYWKTALSIFALSASLALAEDFRTTKGKEYKNATVSRVEPGGIVIKFHGGIVKLPFTELPSDVQKKYEYDPVAAREYAAQRDRVIPRPTATPDANLRTSEATGAQTNVGELNPAEQWVVAQATAGKIAELNKQFPEEEDRQLRADFLETLLTNTRPDVKLHRNGVRIIGACIDEPINLTNAQIPCEVWLVNSQFTKDVDFQRASFTGLIAFTQSKFMADANFNAMKVAGTAFFNETVFEGPVNFDWAEIAGNLQANKTQFKDQKADADFRRMKVGHNAIFEDAVFEGPVLLSADIVGLFEASRAKFKNKQETASFNGMTVGGLASVHSAVFEGPVDFVWARIGGFFTANKAQFKEGVDFAYMKVGSIAFFSIRCCPARST